MASCSSGKSCTCASGRSQASTAPGKPLHTLVDAYLQTEQRLKTPVALFSQAHDFESLPRLKTAANQLIPLSAPGPGEQYAFEVDLDSCSGCKACVSACHSLNGLDDGETWRDVGLILGGNETKPYQQTITSACHHCEEPGCLDGCPVLAYEKNPLTGIVRHLDDQCIGCQYCVLKCPYDVPKYNERLGIVRKCDMCHQRLAGGEAPACVQACPTSAIRIVKMQRTQHRRETAAVSEAAFLKAAPDPSYTKPTTRFRSAREIPLNAVAADLETLRPQHIHLSLVVMLTFTQAGYGLLTAAYVSERSHSSLGTFGMGLICLGLLASVTHLGKPLRAWRIFLGLRRSWLSREAVIFGASFGLLTTWFLLPFAAHYIPLTADMAPPLLLTGLLTGFLGIFCSVMIYADTRRALWRFDRSLLRMAGTTLAFALLPLSSTGTATILGVKLLLELHFLRHSSTRPHADQMSARLLKRPFKRLSLLRPLLGLAALLFCFLGMPIGAASLLLCSELLERSLFFGAVYAPKMPGVPASP